MECDQGQWCVSQRPPEPSGDATLGERKVTENIATNLCEAKGKAELLLSTQAINVFLNCYLY